MAKTDDTAKKMNLDMELGRVSYEAAQVQAQMKVLTAENQKQQAEIARICNEISAINSKKQETPDDQHDEG